MKKSILWVFAAILICGLTVTSLSSCKSDDNDTIVTYSMGIDKMSSSSLEVLSEMSLVENTFKDAVGKVDGVKFTGLGSSTFLYSGDQANIVAACKAAEAGLANQAFQSAIVYKVWRGESAIYTYMTKGLE